MVCDTQQTIVGKGNEDVMEDFNRNMALMMGAEKLCGSTDQTWAV